MATPTRSAAILCGCACRDNGKSRGRRLSLAPDERDSVSYLISVVRGRRKPSGLSSLENNMIVTEILDAARESAKSGKVGCAAKKLRSLQREPRHRLLSPDFCCQF